MKNTPALPCRSPRDVFKGMGLVRRVVLNWFEELKARVQSK